MKKQGGFAFGETGFAHIFLILFLIAGIAVAVYLVQQKTNIFPKAYVSSPVSGPIVSTPTPFSPPLGGDEKQKRKQRELILSVTPQAKCLYNAYSGSEIMLAWTDTANPPSRVELDVGTPDEPDIRTKDVSSDQTVTYAPQGFSGNPELEVGKTYYVRLYNGEYTRPVSFSIPSCMYYPR